MKTTCAGVYRLAGDRGTCSLGRHCDALPLVGDPDAYRDAHSRFSDASLPLPPASPDGDSVSDRARPDQALLDVITDAMGRLDRINPPRDEAP